MEYQLREEIDSSLTPIQQVFYNRGVYDIQHYIHPTEEDLSSPLLLDNLERGIKCLISHIINDDDIFVLIDCDVDGYTSAALLINYLNKLFPHFTQTKIHYDIHNGKEHGLKDKVDELLQHSEYKLIICPDSSSSDLEEHKKLRDNGQDILILDHHQADEITQDRILINNQTCNYPNKELSGVGIVYQFCRYIDYLMQVNYTDDFLDLVATGVVRDMMDVRSLETRFLILKGCENIPKNPLLKNLYYLSEYQIDKAEGLNPFSIGFYIAPYINASIRIGEYDEKIFIFKSMLDFLGNEQILSTKRGHKVGELETWSVQASRLCSNIKSRQQKLRDSELVEITSQIKEKHLDQNKIIVVQRKNSQGNNLSGVIANQIMSIYQHPVLILKETIDEDDRKIWSGSARGIKAKGFDSFRNFALNSELTTLAQGHDMAFGIRIPDENIQPFIQYSNKELNECDFSPYHLVDFIWQANDINTSTILEIAEYSTVWGQALEEPKVAIENIHIKTDNVVVQGKGNIKVLKISLPNGLNLIQFGSAEALEQMKKDICPETARGDNVITIVGTCQRNVWNDQVSAQIKIEGYNIVKKIKYYL